MDFDSARLTRRQALAAGAVSTLAMGGTVAAGNKAASHQAAVPGSQPSNARPANAKIERIDLYPVRYPTRGYFKFFQGPGAYGRGAVIVKMTANDGTVGWGQAVPSPVWSYETLETDYIALKDYLAPCLLGHDPCDIAGAHQRLDLALAPGFSTGMPLARAGLDLALHDLAGKLSGQSVAEMWGLKPGGQIVLSWTVNVLKIDEIEPLVAEGRRQGYRHFNIKVGPDPGFDAQLAKEVRRLAPDAFLWADANGGYTLEAALEAAPKLADAGVDVLEAPFRPNRISGYQRIKKLGALPILMDEGIFSTVELEEFIRLEMLDGLAMKPARCGGLWGNKQQIEIIEREGLMWLGSGLADPDISLAATLCLYAAYGLKRPAALNGPQFLQGDVLSHPLNIANGVATAPTGPGLGIAVDEDKVAELVQQSRHRAAGPTS